jgi:hypothetical protein
MLIWFTGFGRRSMPIKDLQKAREYKRLWAANKRKQNVEPVVEPMPKVEPNVEPLKSVEPEQVVEPKKNVELPNFKDQFFDYPVPDNNLIPTASYKERMPDFTRDRFKENLPKCLLNHHSLAELFKQATLKIKQDYQAIYKDSDAARKCFNCHNLERNYQILLNLLERY